MPVTFLCILLILMLLLLPSFGAAYATSFNPMRGLGPLPDSAHAGWYFANAGYFMFQGLDVNGSSRFKDSKE